MPSGISISNSALVKVGGKRILNLDEDSKEARLCKEQYPKLLLEVLRSHPWNFATKRIEIAELDEEPLWEWDHQFELPSDCLRVLDTSLLESEEWVVEGDKLLCNNDEVFIKYLSSDIDEGLFDENFAEALALRLASDLAYAIAQSIPLQQAMFNAYRLFLAEARSFDAQEGNKRTVESNTFFNSRF